MLNFLGDLPVTFGKVANHILNRLCNFNCKRVDLVFDEIVTPAIKDIRGSSILLAPLLQALKIGKEV